MFSISTHLLQHHEGWLLLAYCSVVLLKMQDSCWFISSTFLALVLGLSYKHLLITLSVSLTIVGSGSGWNLYDALSGHLYVHLRLIFWGVILVWSSLTCFACVIVHREATSGNSVSSLLSEVWYIFFGTVCFLHDCCMRHDKTDPQGQSPKFLELSVIFGNCIWDIWKLHKISVLEEDKVEKDCPIQQIKLPQIPPSQGTEGSFPSLQRPQGWNPRGTTGTLWGTCFLFKPLPVPHILLVKLLIPFYTLTGVPERSFL